MNIFGYVGLGIAMLMLLMQIQPFLQARAQRGRPLPSLDGLSVDPELSTSNLLIYFWSPQCGMCRGMSELVERLRGERQPILSVNINSALEVARRFQVRATPTLIQVREGRLEKVLLGARSEKQLRALLQELKP